MKIHQVTIHNFRGIQEQSLNLENYSLLLGANNAGKSTVVDAIRCFYEKDYKFKAERDFPFKNSSDKESWINIEYNLTQEEYDSLAVEYQLLNQRLKLRKYFQTEKKSGDNKSLSGSIIGYTKEGTLSENHFYGAKGVQSGKIGDLIYIPAVSKVDEHTKLSGPSALRDLVTDVLESVVEASESFSKFTESFTTFSKGVKTEATTDGRSLTGLENELNTLLGNWHTQFHISISPPSTTDLIKSFITHSFTDSMNEKPQSADQFGSGFQRHFIYSLIQIASRYVSKKAVKKSKDFTPVMTLLLFEEPEAFLHPPQQEILARSLQELGSVENRQVICSTHSSHFVSKSTYLLHSLVRVKRDRGIVLISQIKADDWNTIANSNQELTDIAKNWPIMRSRMESDDCKHEMEAVKYFLWLNPERCGLFFSNHVLLVEGPTEKAFINKLISERKIRDNDLGIFILDCMGKYNIHRFMVLLSQLGVSHSVMFDDDQDKNEHKEINELIRSKSCVKHTTKIKAIPKDLEALLEISSTKDHRKPQHVLFLYETGQIKEQPLKAFCELVEEVIS